MISALNTFPPMECLIMNQLFFGDNLVVLREHIKDDSVDLVYLDPPFKSDQNYNVLFREQDGTRSAAQIHDGPQPAGTETGAETHRQYLPALRPHRQPLFENTDGCDLYSAEFSE
jgi:hypothetical protein